MKWEKVITPKAFRDCIGRHNEDFKDSGQKDAAELLSYVLDALHEDLNRVKVRVYGQPPDFNSECQFSEKECAKLTKEFYKKWHDSIISDLFYGFTKSTSTCSECSNSNLKFDQFLTL